MLRAGRKLLCVVASMALVVGLVQVLSIVTSPRTTRAAAVGANGTGGQFVPTQGRLLDTRSASSIGGYSTPFPANTWRKIQVGGIAGVPTTGVSAVAVTFGVTNQANGGYLLADKDEPTPNASISYMNYLATGNQSNSAVLAVAANGKIQVSSNQSTDLIIDVQGYYTADSTVAPGGFVPITPKRLVDTRNGTGLTQAKLAGGSSTAINIRNLYGGGSIPAGASAAMINFTIANYTGPGNKYFWAYPSDGTRPNAAFNFAANTTDATTAQIGLSATGTTAGSLNFDLPGSGYNIDLIVDIVGYFAAGQSSGTFTPAQSTVYDSRANTTIAAGGTAKIQVTGIKGVPQAGSGISSITTNLTAISTGSHTGVLTMWADGTPQPGVSSLIYQPNTVTSNMWTSTLGTNGMVDIYNSGLDAINFVVSVEGWYMNDPPPAAVSADAICIFPTPDDCTENYSDNTVASTRPTITISNTTTSDRYFTVEIAATDGAGTVGNILQAGSTGRVAAGLVGSWKIPTDLSTETEYAYRACAATAASTCSDWSTWALIDVELLPAFIEVSSNDVVVNQFTVARSSAQFAITAGDGFNPTSLSYSLDGGSAQSVSFTPSITMSGLTPGNHVLNVTATDAGGVQSDPAEFQFGLGSRADPVSTVSVTPGSATVDVTWLRANEHGAAVLAYNVSLIDSTTGTTFDLGNCQQCVHTVISGLNGGDAYQVRVIADGEAGPSAGTTSATFQLNSSVASQSCPDGDTTCYAFVAPTTARSHSLAVDSTGSDSSPNTDQCALPVDQRSGAWSCMDDASAADSNPNGNSVQAQGQTSGDVTANSASAAPHKCNITGCWYRINDFVSTFYGQGTFGYGRKAIGSVGFETKWVLSGSQTQLNYFIANYISGGTFITKMIMTAVLFNGAPGVSGHEISRERKKTHKLTYSTNFYRWDRVNFTDRHAFDHNLFSQASWEVQGYTGYWFFYVRSLVAHDDHRRKYRFDDVTRLPGDSSRGGQVDDAILG